MQLLGDRTLRRLGVRGTHLLDLGLEGIEVDKEINSSLCESFHAAFVVGAGVNMVYADAIHAQFGHAGDVALTLLGVDQRVMGHELVGDSWTVSAAQLVDWSEYPS